MNRIVKSSLVAAGIAMTTAAMAVAPSGETLTGGTPQRVATHANSVKASENALAKSFSKKRYAPFRAADNSALQAKFSVLGQADANLTVWSENFDAGMEGWTIQSGNVTWTTKQIAASGAKSFSTIDPDDVQSLFVEGPYQQFKREISTATSQEFTVPDNGSLEAWVGYSLNYDTYCRLTISISADDFATSEEIWNSGNPGDAEKTWVWHEVSVQLGQYAGRTVKLRLTYGSGSDDTFNVGGYMGDFAIDGLKINGKKSIDHIDVETGDIVTFVDITEGPVASRHWSFPGATPAESTEKQPEVYYTADGAYDVTLTVTDDQGNESTETRTAFVNVTGSAPVAIIGAPATFRYSTTGKYMVAPSVPVKFHDASVGFPTESHWFFGGTSEQSNGVQELEGQDVTVVYHYQHDWPLGLTVGNAHGTSDALADVSAEFQGEVSNLRADDQIVVADVWDGEGRFPGSTAAKRKITAYGERFSAPSAPVWIPGVNVYFVDTQAGDIVDQISSVTVSLYTVGADGFPDKKIDSASWSVFELEAPSATGLRPTAFEFTSNPVINEPFIITVEGIPDYREASTEDETGPTLVTFAMAKFRAEGGTAIWQKDGKWQNISDYFPAGQNHTSFMICPYISHSILTTYPLTDSREITVGRDAGTVTKGLYTLYALETPTVDADWARIVSDKSDMTVQDVTIAFDALPGGETERTAHISFTDGATTMVWTLTQSAASGVETAVAAGNTDLKCTPTVVESTLSVAGSCESVKVYDVSGRCVATAALNGGAAVIDATAWSAGAYVVTASDGQAVKIMKR